MDYLKIGEMGKIIIIIYYYIIAIIKNDIIGLKNNAINKSVV